MDDFDSPRQNELRATEGLRLLQAELHRRAANLARREAPGAIEPTSLIHELYLHFSERGNFLWRSREHFITDASREMRRILVARARERRAMKRGGGWRQITLHSEVIEGPERQVDLLVLEEALTQLETLEPRQCRIVELRFFGDLTLEQVARVLGVTVRTVSGDWAMARAWLGRRLRGDDGGKE